MYITADKIIRDTFSDKEDAIPFFKAVLPKIIINDLDLTTLKVVQRSFIDEGMAEFQTDLLFQIQTKEKSFTNIYLLFEHKSIRDRRTFNQLLSYLARIYAHQKSPVPVIPFMLYHGKKSWDLGTQFQDQFQFDKNEKALYLPYLPNFQFELFDLGERNIESLNITLYVRLLFQIIRSIDLGQLKQNLRSVFEASFVLFSNKKTVEKFRKLLLYVFARGNLAAEEVVAVLSSISPQMGDAAMTTAEQLIKKGFEQGIEQGIEKGFEQGIEKGLQEILIKQSQWKFGKLTADEKNTVLNCTDRLALENASRAILDGQAKSEVLAPLPTNPN